MKLKVLKYKYHVLEPSYLNVNITEKNGELIAQFDLRRDNLMQFVNTIIHFEDNHNEFGIEFMNRTIDLCKLLSNRRYEPLMGLIYEAVKDNAPSMPKKCPIKKVNKHRLNSLNF